MTELTDKVFSQAYWELSACMSEMAVRENASANSLRFIGCIGDDVPEEILIAAGYTPIQIRSDLCKETPIADKYLELAFEQSIKAKFEAIISGKYSFVERIVISNSSDVLVRLYYYLRQIRNVERELLPMPVHFFDIKLSQYRASTMFNRTLLKGFIEDVGSWNGKELTGEDIAHAINICSDTRASVRKMLELRTGEEVKVTGTQAMTIISAYSQMPKEKYAGLMKSFVNDAMNFHAIQGKRLFLSGSSHENTDFYELVESCGAIIIGEDHDSGSRLFMGPKASPQNAIASIVDFYQTRYPGSKKSLVADRMKYAKKYISSANADGLIFYVADSDDAVAWEYPEFKKMANEIGLPVLFLSKRNTNLKDEVSVKKLICEFIQSMGVSQ